MASIQKLFAAFMEGLHEWSWSNPHICSKVQASIETEDESLDYDHELMEAAKDGCADCLGKLIQAGAGVNKASVNGLTALMKAASNGYSNCVNVLIQGGADVSLVDKHGCTALFHAVWNGEVVVELGRKYECIEALLRAIGSNVNGYPEGAEPPLMSIARYGNLQMLMSLIDMGADVNWTDSDGCTALMKAAKKDHIPCLKALLKAGADVNIMDKKGWHALKMAAAASSCEAIDLLIEAGADVSDDMKESFLPVIIGHDLPYTTCRGKDITKIYRCFGRALELGAVINCWDSDERPMNVLQEYMACSNTKRGPVHMLLLSAGERVDGKAKKVILKKYMEQEDQLDALGLKHLSREVVREQMITARPHDNLFRAVPKLDIPCMVKSYLVYDVSLVGKYDQEKLYRRYGRPDEYDSDEVTDDNDDEIEQDDEDSNNDEDDGNDEDQN